MVQSMIEISKLSKRYLLGENAHLDQTIPEKINEMIGNTGKRLMGRSKEIRRGPREELWALKDIDFSVTPGEVVGIIGQNGAGKSTLLKLLSRITDPTDGYAKIYGRVGSLLEVGTGFHPELTGKENIYLNGAILGMSQSEIRGKYDEIVEFSELGKFMDTPVKRYSSGMYVRLAFAVAAHLEPEVLIIDEVLAGGDAKFQSKCMAKMKDVAGHGRTVLFVSHNMGLVSTLCERGIVLDHGEMLEDTTARKAVELYLSQLEDRAAAKLIDRTDRRGDGEVRIHEVIVEGTRSASVVCGEPMRIIMKLTGAIKDSLGVLSIFDNAGQALIDLRSRPVSGHDIKLDEPSDEVICTIDCCPLVPGRYRLDTSVFANRAKKDQVEGALYFNVAPGNVGGRSIDEQIRNAKMTVPAVWTLP